MDKGERQALAERIRWLRYWSDLARWAESSRQEVVDHSRAARDRFEARSFTCAVGGRPYTLVPLDEHLDASLIADLLGSRSIQPLTARDLEALSIGSDDARAVLSRAKSLLGPRRHFMSGKRRKEREADVQMALGMYEWAWTEQLGVRVKALVPDGLVAGHPALDVARELAGPGATTVSGQQVLAARTGIEALRRIASSKESAEAAIQKVGTRIREQGVQRSLSEMPVRALKTSTSGRLRLGAVEQAGLSSVHDVLEFGPSLISIDGVGEQTARQTWAAAETMQSMVQRETPLRIDVKRRDAETEQLLKQLWIWGMASTMLMRANEAADSVTDLAPLVDRDIRGADGVRLHFVITGEDQAARLTDALVALARWDEDARLLDRPPKDPWSDFLARPADYLGWVSLLGFLTEDGGAAEGQLSDDLVRKVRSQDLDTSLLRDVSLRGYQDFGARFALAQRKVVIGDEMGLGKTIEALAVLAHLHAKGATHSVVVCPAAVLSNWSREVSARSDLEVFVVHGGQRWSRVQRWSRRGGVAVTTFATLRSVLDEVTGQGDVHGVIVDEAHYIKNPDAKRTVSTRELIDAARYGLLLTGTPIENRLEEFANLVSYLQPDLLRQLGAHSPAAFPSLIAPAYLRRNQEDVLTELPERIDVEEWVPMSRQDEAQYVAAVADGNFMAMRRAALLGGDQSTKLQRLVELVQEARANHRKVIVFSYFRDVLDAVVKVLDGDLFGPMTGSVTAGERQRLVDRYTEAPAGAVLVSQIAAGGVGLNIQAGSVVIICEPQVKPNMESQAVARAHRMGQTETVQVHRLLSDEGVDRRMVEILAEKQRLFDEFARVSHTADSAPEALDISEAELAREVIAAERERLARRTQMDEATPIEESA